MFVLLICLLGFPIKTQSTTLSSFRYEHELVSRVVREGLLIDKINNIQDVFVKRELSALALNIYHEARGSTKDDMVAVGIVTMNRVGDNQFRNTVEEVVFQNKQFSWTNNNVNGKIPTETSWVKCQELAYAVYTGEETNNKIVNKKHYSRHDIVGKRVWHRKMHKRVRIGSHIYMS